MATFPTAIPAPRLDGYALAPQDRTIRSEMDGGVARVRRRNTAPPITHITATWTCGADVFALLDGWLDAYGHDWFDIQLVGPIGPETVSARTMGARTARPVGTTALWEVSAALEIRAFTSLGAEYIEVMSAYGAALIPAYGVLHPWVAGQLSQGYYP